MAALLRLLGLQRTTALGGAPRGGGARIEGGGSARIRGEPRRADARGAAVQGCEGAAACGWEMGVTVLGSGRRRPVCAGRRRGGELGKKLGFGIYMPLRGSHNYTVIRRRQKTFWHAEFTGAEFSGLRSRGSGFLSAISNRQE